MFKYLNGFTTASARGLFGYDLTNRTTYNGAKLIVKHFNTSVSKHFYLIKTTTWNVQPNEFVSSRTVNSLRNRLDKHYEENPPDVRVNWYNHRYIYIVMNLVHNLVVHQKWPVPSCYRICWCIPVGDVQLTIQFRIDLAASPWIPWMCMHYFYNVFHAVPCQMVFENSDKLDLPLYCCPCHMCLCLGQRSRAGFLCSYVCFWIHFRVTYQVVHFQEWLVSPF